LHEFQEYRHPSKAQSWLERSGWQEGAGIGLNQQGITSALKTKQRSDNGGLGRPDDAEEANAWWLDGFLLAARKLQRNRTASDTDTVAIVPNKPDGGIVDPLCPLYSRFVRASSTTTTTTTKVSADETSTTTTVTTAVVDVSRETFDACGGKAARYIMPGAKLARVAQQDLQFHTKRKLDDFEHDSGDKRQHQTDDDDDDAEKQRRKAAKKAAKLEAKKAAKKEAKRQAKKNAKKSQQ
jgi:hypothetical protein